MQFSVFEAYAVEVGTTVAVTPETQNGDYESGIAHIGGEAWHIRTVPFGDDAVAAGLLVFVEQQGRRGVFRFTGAHLAELGITSGGRKGKRGFRVYASWCAGLNSTATATSTQRAQASAFEEF